MNPSAIKPLIQIKRHEDKPDDDRLSVVMLVDVHVLKSLLEQVQKAEDGRAAIVVEMNNPPADLTIEAYRPHECKNLRYAENLKRDGHDGWTTLTAATL